METKTRFKITGNVLHILGMVLMLADHLWGTVVPGNDWMTVIGRVSFPIFAFMIVEGFFHTGSLKKYVTRLLIFAVVSEIPFNLAIGGRVFYPTHQNVLWTFLIAIGLMWLNERVREKKPAQRVLVFVGTLLLGYILGLVTMVDYMHAGVLTVLVFYFFRERTWFCRAAQLVLLWYINAEILGGLVYPVELFGSAFEISQQGFAVFALVPIWLYNGERGKKSKALQYAFYAFYPAHLLILGLIALI